VYFYDKVDPSTASKNYKSSDDEHRMIMDKDFLYDEDNLNDAKESFNVYETSPLFEIVKTYEYDEAKSKKEECLRNEKTFKTSSADLANCEKANCDRKKARRLKARVNLSSEKLKEFKTGGKRKTLKSKKRHSAKKSTKKIRKNKRK
jgi:hypothetical protein